MNTFFVYGFSEKSENKYSNISIALLFSSPTKKRAKVTCSIDLGSIFLLERFVNNYTNRVGCRSECAGLKSTFSLCYSAASAAFSEAEPGSPS